MWICFFFGFFSIFRLQDFVLTPLVFQQVRLASFSELPQHLHRAVRLEFQSARQHIGMLPFATNS
jgi:hypothetical protein